MYFRNQKDSWAVSAQSCKEENSESFAGQHSADSTSFYLLDESSAVPDKIFEVAEGGLSDGEPMIIACGNPTRNTGKFHRITFGNERERWTRFSVDSRNSRLSNKALIAQWAADYGEDSDFFRVRVRGECPRAGTTQFISSDDVAVCRKYKAEGFATLPKIMAVDVARFGDDRSVIGLRQGRKFRILGKYRGVDTVQLTRRVVEAREREEPDALIVDGETSCAIAVSVLACMNFAALRPPMMPRCTSTVAPSAGEKCGIGFMRLPNSLMIQRSKSISRHPNTASVPSSKSSLSEKRT